MFEQLIIFYKPQLNNLPERSRVVAVVKLAVVVLVIVAVVVLVIVGVLLVKLSETRITTMCYERL